MTETERQLRSARAELENKSNSKGMAGGAAAILGARDRGEIKGIIGTIAELCAPIDSEHETALATAFGGAMTSVVVDSDEVAAEAIRWLAQRKAGRATFLPLNKLSTSRAGGKAMMVARKPGVIGFAYELLEYDPRIDTAIKFALRARSSSKTWTLLAKTWEVFDLSQCEEMSLKLAVQWLVDPSTNVG